MQIGRMNMTKGVLKARTLLSHLNKQILTLSRRLIHKTAIHVLSVGK